MQEECGVAGTVLLSGGYYISDTRVGEQIISTDSKYPIVYETRESAFMFHDVVDLGAGTHNLCWRQDGATTGVTLGAFTIQGRNLIFVEGSRTGPLPEYVDLLVTPTRIPAGIEASGIYYFACFCGP